MYIVIPDISLDLIWEQGMIPHPELCMDSECGNQVSRDDTRGY